MLDLSDEFAESMAGVGNGDGLGDEGDRKGGAEDGDDVQVSRSVYSRAARTHARTHQMPILRCS